MFSVLATTSHRTLRSDATFQTSPKESYTAVSPPSAATAAPVTKLALSLAKKTMTFAISSGRPSLFVGQVACTILSIYNGLVLSDSVAECCWREGRRGAYMVKSLLAEKICAAVSVRAWHVNVVLSAIDDKDWGTLYELTQDRLRSPGSHAVHHQLHRICLCPRQLHLIISHHPAHITPQRPCMESSTYHACSPHMPSNWGELSAPASSRY